VAIHQALGGRPPGAVRREVLALKAEFEKRGESIVFEEGAELPDAADGDVLLVHGFAAGSIAALSPSLTGRNLRLALRWHSQGCATAVPAPAAGFELALADSEAAAHALRGRGWAKVVAVPTVAGARFLRDLEPPALPELEPGPVIAFTGPLSEVGGTHLAIQAFHVLTTYHSWEARLALAGQPCLDGYAHALNRMILELGLHGVQLMSGLDERDLAAVYRRADVALAIGSSDDYDLQTLEAMSFGVPVVACPAARLRGPALAVRELSPARVAVALDRVMRDGQLREQLSRRSSDFAAQQAETALSTILSELARR
jgi:glycosyltransferase involved in cell wall biosynthesis